MRALLLVLVACGGPQRGSSAPDCPTVAEHLVVLAEHDAMGPAGANGPGLQAELAHRCRDEAWTAERRVCLHAALDQEATLDCPLE